MSRDNPDPVVETYYLPVRPAPANPVTFTIRRNARKKEFTAPGRVYPYYVSRDGGGGFCTEADTLADARDTLAAVAARAAAETVAAVAACQDLVAAVAATSGSGDAVLSYRAARERRNPFRLRLVATDYPTHYRPAEAGEPAGFVLYAPAGAKLVHDPDRPDGPRALFVPGARHLLGVGDAARMGEWHHAFGLDLVAGDLPGWVAPPPVPPPVESAPCPPW